VTITVRGLPGPQGSKRYVGKGIMIESSKKVKPWREAVKWAAIEAMSTGAGEGMRGPISVEMTFTLPKPKSAPKRMRTWPDRKPDLSKLVRSTEDALTDVCAIEDDARIVECICRKVFPGEHVDSLSTPGAVIRLGVVA
jgi:Holliday junction resolvase RusA-like endonuclease